MMLKSTETIAIEDAFPSRATLILRRFFYNIFTNLFFVFTLVISCSSGGEEPDGGGGPVDPPSEIIPTNLSVNITIEGSSSENPNGDGSGLVKFSASATNAVSYSYRFGTGDSKTSTGAVELLVCFEKVSCSFPYNIVRS